VIFILKDNNEQDLVVIEAEEIINSYIKKQSEFSHKFVLKKKKEPLMIYKYIVSLMIISVVFFYFWIK
jgi:hypothetical protein